LVVTKSDTKIHKKNNGEFPVWCKGFMSVLSQTFEQQIVVICGQTRGLAHVDPVTQNVTERIELHNSDKTCP
jgi:hypothetical protein